MANSKQIPDLPQGIQKETTRHPPSHRYMPPKPGDSVEVHCVQTLKHGGIQFDSTRDRGHTFTYTVGQGDVIKGWDLGVQTMRKGEHAKFTVDSEFAYGEAGDEGRSVPPCSHVIVEVELVKCPMREDLFEDGGAIKQELNDDKGGRQPRNGDECQVTYKVTVEDCGVAMAGQHTVYKCGSTELGQISKVINKALSTMKRGDEACVTLAPNYAFGVGNGQYAGKIATLFLALEQIYEVHDTSLGEKDKTVLRKRIKEGEGTDRCHDTAHAKIHVLSASANGEKVIHERREISFTVGNGEVCDALDGSLLDLKVGEEAILRCESSAAVAGGLLGLPDGLETPIMIHIAVVSFEKVDEKWDLDGAGRLERGRARKEIATELFKRGRIRAACHLYELIATLFERLDFFKQEQQKDAAELRRVASLNRAMCMLKFGNMKTVHELCTSVLADDPANPKALFRRGKARVALKEYAGAIEDLRRLLEVEPNSIDGRALLREATRLDKQNNSLQSRTFAKMCDGLGQMPERDDRRDDDLVVMPDMEQEAMNIAIKHGLPMPKRASRRLPPTEDQIVDEPEIAEAMGQASVGGALVTAPIEISAATLVVEDASEAVKTEAVVA